MSLLIEDEEQCMNDVADDGHRCMRNERNAGSYVVVDNNRIDIVESIKWKKS